MDISRRKLLGTSAATAAMGLTGANALQAEGAQTPDDAYRDIVDLRFKSDFGRGFTSDAIHAGQRQGTVTPIYQGKHANGYARPSGGPTVDALEEKIRHLEGGEAAYTGPCGMSVITQTHLTLLSAGERVVTHRCVYNGTTELYRNHLPRWGIEVEFIDMNDLDNLRRALKKKKTKIVCWEPYVNPTMEVLNTPEIIKTAKEYGAITVVDNCFLSPYLLQPLRYGADLVLHSTTKYLSGHGAAMGGIVTGKAELIKKIERANSTYGSLLRPLDAFLINIGTKSLSWRMERHSENAQKVAEWLEGHPKVARVHYGGLRSWPGHKVGKSHIRAYGGMMGVEWKSEKIFNNFHKHLKMCKVLVSYGDPETLAIPWRYEPGRGIPRNYTRIQVGLEDVEDIIVDFKQALEKS